MKKCLLVFALLFSCLGFAEQRHNDFLLDLTDVSDSTILETSPSNGWGIFKHEKHFFDMRDFKNDCVNKTQCELTLRIIDPVLKDNFLCYFKLDLTGDKPKILEIINSENSYYIFEKTADNAIRAKYTTENYFYIANATGNDLINISGSAYGLRHIPAHRGAYIYHDDVRKPCMNMPVKQCALDVTTGFKIGKIFIDTTQMKITKVESPDGPIELRLERNSVFLQDRKPKNQI